MRGVNGAAGVLARRLLQALLALVVLSAVAFTLPRLAAGDPTIALYGAEASAADRAALRSALGLDAPLTAQYARWVEGALGGGHPRAGGFFLGFFENFFY